VDHAGALGWGGTAREQTAAVPATYTAKCHPCSMT
jgi:hypothetical protein